MGQPTVGFVCDEDDDLGLNVGAEIHLNFDQISSQIDLRNFDVILITDFFFLEIVSGLLLCIIEYWAPIGDFNWSES